MNKTGMTGNYHLSSIVLFDAINLHKGVGGVEPSAGSPN